MSATFYAEFIMSLLHLALAHRAVGALGAAHLLAGEAMRVCRDALAATPATASDTSDAKSARTAAAPGDKPPAASVEQSLLTELLGHAQHHVGTLHKELGDFAAAHRAYQDALDCKTAALGGEHATVGATLNSLGALCTKRR